MSITYGQHGSWWVVRHSGRVVGRAKTEGGAYSKAHRRAGQFGGKVTKEPDPPPAAAFDPTPVLSGRIRDIRDALETGRYDDHLDALLKAEAAGNSARVGALKAIRERKAR